MAVNSWHWDELRNDRNQEHGRSSLQYYQQWILPQNVSVLKIILLYIKSSPEQRGLRAPTPGVSGCLGYEFHPTGNLEFIFQYFAIQCKTADSGKLQNCFP
jgi:hypothetical protein